MILIHSKMTCQVAVGILVIFESSRFLSRFLATHSGGTTTVNFIQDLHWWRENGPFCLSHHTSPLYL